MTSLLTVSAGVYLVVGWTWMFRGHLRRERRRGASGFGWGDVYWSVFMASACCSAWIIWAAILIARKHISLSAYQFALVVGGETPEEKTRRTVRTRTTNP